MSEETKDVVVEGAEGIVTHGILVLAAQLYAELERSGLMPEEQRAALNVAHELLNLHGGSTARMMPQGGAQYY